MIQTSRDGDNSGRVRTHEKNWGETVPPIGHNNTKHLLCPIRSRHLFEFLKIVRWESVPRCSFARSWGNFRPAFSPDPTNCPWVSEDGEAVSRHQMKHREESWKLRRAGEYFWRTSLCWMLDITSQPNDFRGRNYGCKNEQFFSWFPNTHKTLTFFCIFF